MFAIYRFRKSLLASVLREMIKEVKFTEVWEVISIWKEYSFRESNNAFVCGTGNASKGPKLWLLFLLLAVLKFE